MLRVIMLGIFFAIGLALFIIGYLIKYKNKLTLIAGVDQAKVDKMKNPDFFAKLVGNLVMTMGLLTFLAPLLAFMITPLLVFAGYGILIVLISVSMIFAMNLKD